MFSTEQSEEVTRFCRQAVAFDAESSPDAPRYITVRAGRKFTRSEQVIDRVVVSPTGEIVEGGGTGEVIGSTAEELEVWLLEQLAALADEHPRIYLAVYAHSAKNPTRPPLRLDIGEAGGTSTDDELAPQPIHHDWSNGPNALMGSVGGMVERTNLLLARQLDNALNRYHGTMDEVGELRAHLARLVTEREHFDETGAVLEAASRAAAMRDAFERAAPILEQVAPIVAGGVGTWFAAQAALAHAQAAKASGEEGPPEDPAAATGYHVARLRGALGALGAHVQATKAITPEQIAELEQMMQLAGAAAAMWKAQQDAPPVDEAA